MKKILVAYDGTDPAKTALQTALTLATATKSEVGVVSVVPYRMGRAPMDPWDDREFHDTVLREAQTVLRAAGIEPRLLEPAGDPAKMIERISAREGYDTIVVGTRDLDTVGRFLEGSVSEHVATHAKATVVIAR